MHITHINKPLRSSAFTLLEYCIVIAIIGLLAAIAVPSCLRARQENQTRACINNLRLIEINGANETIYVTPKCPAGGTYKLDTATKRATCSYPGHKLTESVLDFPDSYQAGNCTLLEIKKQLNRETLEFTHEEIWRFEKSHPELRVTGHQIMAFPSPIIWVSIRHEPKTNAAMLEQPSAAH